MQHSLALALSLPVVPLLSKFIRGENEVDDGYQDPPLFPCGAGTIKLFGPVIKQFVRSVIYDKKCFKYFF